MKKALKTILICIAIGLVIGFINSHLIYANFWQHFFKGYNSVPGYVHILYGFLALFCAVAAHELGHFFMFKKQGIPVKAIYILGIAFVNDNGLKIRFVPKFFLLIGGIVIPEHISITDEATEKDVIDKFKKVLLAGPNTSIIYGIVVFILWACFLMFNLYVLNGFLITFMWVTILMTVMAVMASKVARSGMYGDYAAIKALDKDLFFRLAYLTQLTTLLKHDIASIDYFWPKLVDMLDKKGIHSHKLYPNLLGQYLYGVTFDQQIGCTSIDKKIESMRRNCPKTEDGFILYINMICYYEAMGHKDMVSIMVNQFDTTVYHLDDKVRTYYLRLLNHLLKFKDESSFLNHSKNIKTSSLDWVYKPLRLTHDIKEIIR